MSQAARPPRESRAQHDTAAAGHWAVEHFLKIVWHRKWLVLGVFVLVSLGTFVYSYRLPNVYQSETVILVDPQKVPEVYVKSTVTGDIRNRLSTLSQQILSATRLQRIIETLNLYPEERKTMAREDVIALMRKDIPVTVLSDFGASQDLQAFRIGYSGREPRLVAQVANQIASLFIEENLKAREQQAAGTTEFLENQLVETRKALEEQEAKLRDFKLRHIGSMPAQEGASLQILGQLQSQLQSESESLARAEQEKSYVQSLIAASSTPVVDMDQREPAARPAAPKVAGPAAPTQKPPLAVMQERLAALESRYSQQHPDVRKLRRQVQDEKQRVAKAGDSAPVGLAIPEAVTPEPLPALAQSARPMPAPVKPVNPVLETQLRALRVEIDKHREEKERLSKQIGTYQSRLESIPVNESQITALERDYEISKTHYRELLGKQLSAETATQLERRQKGEKFSVLDSAQPAERPSRPHRSLINGAGCLIGLALGLMCALITEVMGFSITGADQITAAVGIPVLEVIPVIYTQADRMIHRRRMVFGVGGAVMASIVAGGFLAIYRYQNGGL